VLEPIWSTKTETASRLRQRIEAVLDWAAVRGHRSGDNPARWRGHLESLLPAKAKVAKHGHHAALPYADLPGFFLKLQVHDGIGARALEFAILTAARTGEVLGAKWDEIDMAERLWTVPGERMKAGREHRVPLTEPALVLLRKMQAVSLEGGFVFPGTRKDRPLSNMAMAMAVRRMGHDEITPHGFRSTFRDWCAERTSFPAEVAAATCSTSAAAWPKHGPDSAPQGLPGR
jgi:integrase